MRHVLKLVLIAVVFAGLGLQGALAAPGTPAKPQAGEWLKKAYLSVVDAELARADHHEADAARAYRTALGFYGRLQAEYPDWQTAIVSYRVAECQNALATVEMPEVADVSARTNASPGEASSNTMARIESLLGELSEVKGILALDRNTGDDSTTKSLEKALARLKGELGDAVKANQLLQRKVTKLEAKLNRAGLGGSMGTNTPYKAVAAAVKAEARQMMQANDMPGSIALLMEAVELMPTETDLFIQLAVAFCRDGKFAEAVTMLKPYDVRNPQNADALLTLGAAYMGLGKIGEARVATEKALDINPDSAESHYNMAQILVTLTPVDVDGAQQHYLRATELGLPADPDFENTLRTALIISRLKKHPGDANRQTLRQRIKASQTPVTKSGTP